MTSTEQRLNIPSTVKDPHYRYTMPKIQITTQGSGNGIKTNWVNLPEVSNALKVPLEYPIKFIARELGSNTETKSNSFLINGSHNVEKMQELLDKFIKKYVLCQKCHLPEIHGKVRVGKKGAIKSETFIDEGGQKSKCENYVEFLSFNGATTRQIQTLIKLKENGRTVLKDFEKLAKTNGLNKIDVKQVKGLKIE